VKQRKTNDPLEGLSLDQVIHYALGKAKQAAEDGPVVAGSLTEAAAWSSVAQAAATFHLSLTLGQ
jgi:hypothetical protein